MTDRSAFSQVPQWWFILLHWFADSHCGYLALQLPAFGRDTKQSPGILW